MGLEKHAGRSDQRTTETRKETEIDKPPGSHRLTRALWHSSDALPYLLFGFFTISLVLTPHTLIDEPSHIGTFNLCSFFGTDRCGSWLWSGWLCVLASLA